MSWTFELNTREDVQKFDEQLNAFRQKKAHTGFPSFCLLDAYDGLQGHEEFERLFTLACDMKSNAVLANIDLITAVKFINQYSRIEMPNNRRILDSSDHFEIGVSLLRFNGAFIVRYRALWDKIFSFLILYGCPQRYKPFINAKGSRKKPFLSIARSESLLISADECQRICSLLERFEGEYRTPEVHGAGRLRTWVFGIDSINNTSQVDLMYYWNEVNGKMGLIGSELHKRAHDLNSSI